MRCRTSQAIPSRVHWEPFCLSITGGCVLRILTQPNGHLRSPELVGEGFLRTTRKTKFLPCGVFTPFDHGAPLQLQPRNVVLRKSRFAFVPPGSFLIVAPGKPILDRSTLGVAASWEEH